MIKKIAKLILPNFLIEIIRDFLLIPKKRNAKAKIRQWQKSDIEKELSKHEFKIFSQNGEDGILFYIFDNLGTTNRYFVEIGAGTGVECNTANLSVNFGWEGILIDGSKENIDRAKSFYKTRKETKLSSIKPVQSFVTKENINEVLLDNGAKGEIDLLSIDIDGNDYWIWQVIKTIKPRVVVIEYNASLGPNKSLTVEYDQNFEILKKHPSGFYHGASLLALTKLANSKGYILVGCDSNGVNAFFVKREIAQGKFSEVSPQKAFFPNSWRSNKKQTLSQQFELIKNLKWIEI